mmetsp:Transcript_14377/g.36750  ORF Transcript_14377/g.36750 Transcript_14377/m.36750 type:complete len:240 (+) Transcript_14377:84-803(+)
MMAAIEDERKLYVANLPHDIMDTEVRKVFGLYGELTEVHINKLKDGNTLRSAFVRFEDPGDAAAAIAVLSDMWKFRENQQYPLRVSVARRSMDDKGKGKGGYTTFHADGGMPPSAPGGLPPAPPAPPYGANGGAHGEPGAKLWVGNLPGDITPEQMTQIFSAYGRVTEVNILPAKSRSGQLCAFVNYSSPHEADACARVMQAGFEIRPGEGEIRVERPSSGKGKAPKGAGKGKPHYAPY